MKLPSPFRILAFVGVVLWSASSIAQTISGTLLVSGPPGQTKIESRFLRNGVSNACGNPKSFAGLIGNGGYDYQVRPIPHFGTAACATIQFRAECDTGGADFFVVAYANTFDVTNPQLNYLGDPGDSVGSTAKPSGAFSVSIPAGMTLLLVPNLISNSGLSGCTFSITVAGLTSGAVLDVDANGKSDALTDGLLLLRYLFGLRGAALLTGAIGPGANRTTPGVVEGYIQTLTK